MSGAVSLFVLSVLWFVLFYFWAEITILKKKVEVLENGK